MHERGASVAILDLDEAEAVEAAERIGPRALALAADVTDEAGIDAAVASTVETFGGLDIAVANAGIAPVPRTARAMGTEAFERVLEVNLLGVWRTVRAAMPHLIERRGQLVLVASVYAFFNGVMASPYATSKAGVEALGRALRLELAPHGASATVAYFGFVDTDMVRDCLRRPDRRPPGGTDPRRLDRPDRTGGRRSRARARSRAAIPSRDRARPLAPPVRAARGDRADRRPADGARREAPPDRSRSGRRGYAGALAPHRRRVLPQRRAVHRPQRRSRGRALLRRRRRGEGDPGLPARGARRRSAERELSAGARRPGSAPGRRARPPRALPPEPHAR